MMEMKMEWKILLESFSQIGTDMTVSCIVKIKKFNLLQGDTVNARLIRRP